MIGDHRTVVSFLRLRRLASRQQGRARVGARHLAVLAAIVLLHPIAAPQTKEVRSILILNEVGTSYPAIPIISQGIQTALRNSTYQLEFYSEYLDTILFPDPAVQQEFRDFYIRKYENRKPDVIITVGPSPLRFMQEVHQRAFAGIPIVFCLPAGSVPGAPALDSDFIGVENDVAPAETLEIALRLQSGTEHLVVVGGVSDFDKQLQAYLKRQLQGFADHLDITYLTDLGMPDLLERLRHLPHHTVVLVTTVGQDAAGARFNSSETGPMVAAAANAPVFSLLDVYLNHGEVGGYLSNLSEQGAVAGGMALRILRGEKPRDIAMVKGVNTYMFDWQALKRWGLKEKELPQGSIVINRQRTIWDLYKWYFVGGVGLVLVQTLMIFGLLWQRSELRRSEKALRESEERFRLVANTAPVMIWMSGPDKLCNYVNKTWLDFTGRPHGAELGDDWAGGLHPDDLGRTLQTYTEAFDRRESFETQYRLRRHDGKYRCVLDKGVPRFNPDHTFAGYIGSCIDITDRKLAEETMSTIGRRLIEAHEEERTWIGRELHDDINQRLALLAAELDRWGQRIPPANEFIAQVLNAQRRVTEIAKDVQGLSHRLHSSKLEYLGLATGAKSFCREMSEQSKVEVQFTQTGIPRSLPKEISLCLFRVLQEALQNAVKHSGVRSFTVDLHGTEEAIELTVKDAGRGFEEQEAFTRSGLGLISMRERLQMVGGEFEVKSKPGAGTKIYARVPIKTQSYRALAG
jgi:PAS domain S-box-containing protein